MANNEIRVRLAGTRDRRAFPEIDPHVSSDLQRREAIDSAIAGRRCWIADVSGKPAGYGILSRNFFGRDFIELLFVAEAERRHGVGGAILSAIENARDGSAIFTSTNESNAPMRALLTARDYRPSGRVENLDPGDPELIFVKIRPPQDKSLPSVAPD